MSGARTELYGCLKEYQALEKENIAAPGQPDEWIEGGEIMLTAPRTDAAGKVVLSRIDRMRESDAARCTEEFANLASGVRDKEQSRATMEGTDICDGLWRKEPSDLHRDPGGTLKGLGRLTHRGVATMCADPELNGWRDASSVSNDSWTSSYLTRPREEFKYANADAAQRKRDFERVKALIDAEQLGSASCDDFDFNPTGLGCARAPGDVIQYDGVAWEPGPYADLTQPPGVSKTNSPLGEYVATPRDYVIT